MTLSPELKQKLQEIATIVHADLPRLIDELALLDAETKAWGLKDDSLEKAIELLRISQGQVEEILKHWTEET